LEEQITIGKRGHNPNDKPAKPGARCLQVATDAGRENAAKTGNITRCEER
jgi:hypothetical protein